MRVAVKDAVRRYARLQVPRYTSYPTAAEFSSGLSADTHRRLIGTLDASEAVSLYVHVPYCRDICFYCGCHSKKASRPDVIAAYRDAIEREIDLVGTALGKPVRAARLHWGGGTPSTLGQDGLASVVAALRRWFVFQPGFEHAIELDPRYVTPDLADALAALGVNRASLGVQDVDPVVQSAIGRLQPVPVVEAAVARLRAAGVERLNFDLIYGLPSQTTASLRETCATVAGLGPDRIAYYGYAHIPERKAHQRLIDGAALPQVEERLAQAEAIAEVFQDKGYVRIGIDHFAKPEDPLAHAAASGTLHRNFQGYTDDEHDVLIGFGASAISQFRGGFVQNIADVPGYARAVGGGELATARGCEVDAGHRQRARIIERLMCQFRVDLDQIAPETDFGDELRRLEPLIADGVACVSDRVISISDEGRPVARVVASVFDVFYSERIGRFSAAV